MRKRNKNNQGMRNKNKLALYDVFLFRNQLVYKFDINKKKAIPFLSPIQIYKFKVAKYILLFSLKKSITFILPLGDEWTTWHQIVYIDSSQLQHRKAYKCKKKNVYTQCSNNFPCIDPSQLRKKSRKNFVTTKGLYGSTH